MTPIQLTLQELRTKRDQLSSIITSLEELFPAAGQNSTVAPAPQVNRGPVIDQVRELLGAAKLPSEFGNDVVRARAREAGVNLDSTALAQGMNALAKRGCLVLVRRDGRMPIWRKP